MAPQRGLSPSAQEPIGDLHRLSGPLSSDPYSEPMDTVDEVPQSLVTHFGLQRPPAGMPPVFPRGLLVRAGDQLQVRVDLERCPADRLVLDLGRGQSIPRGHLSDVDIDQRIDAVTGVDVVREVTLSRVCERELQAYGRSRGGEPAVQLNTSRPSRRVAVQHHDHVRTVKAVDELVGETPAALGVRRGDQAKAFSGVDVFFALEQPDGLPRADSVSYLWCAVKNWEEVSGLKPVMADELLGELLVSVAFGGALLPDHLLDQAALQIRVGVSLDLHPPACDFELRFRGCLSDRRRQVSPTAASLSGLSLLA